VRAPRKRCEECAFSTRINVDFPALKCGDSRKIEKAGNSLTPTDCKFYEPRWWAQLLFGATPSNGEDG
jgi:hypothetical protein